MPLMVELPDDLANALTVEARHAGLSLSEYATQLLSNHRALASTIRTGADLVAFWQKENLFGSLSDIHDSSAYAREIRDIAERRVR